MISITAQTFKHILLNYTATLYKKEEKSLQVVIINTTRVIWFAFTEKYTKYQ